jgi:hypothetical protein
VFVASFSKAIVLDIYSGFINNFSVAMDLAKMEAKRKSALADFLKVNYSIQLFLQFEWTLLFSMLLQSFTTTCFGLYWPSSGGTQHQSSFCGAIKMTDVVFHLRMARRGRNMV